MFIIGKWVFFFFFDCFIGFSIDKIITGGGAVPPAEVINLGLHITEAIGALSTIGKAHRDIKPGSIMFDQSDSRFVLLDTSLAFDIAGDPLNTGIPRGAPRYFSPEQFERSNRRPPLNLHSDMFSLGIVMYEAITGRHPVCQPADTMWRMFYAMSTIDPEPPTRWAPEAPPMLAATIMRMLAKLPQDRYADCEALNRELRAAQSM
jgi:serine/threonine protein kinase